MSAGEWPLALAAARILDRAGALQPDGRFLLLAEAVKREDWTAAEAEIGRMEKEELFAFAAPLLRAWTAVSAGRRDPMAALPPAGEESAAAAYAAEHRPLIAIAAGDARQAAALAAVADAAGGRGGRLRIAGAATLAEQGKKPAALALLAGEDPALAVARAALEAGRPLPGAIDGAASGMAEFLVKFSLDLNAGRLAPLALGFSRLSTWLAPDNSEARLVAAELLAADGRPEAAIAELGGVASDDPYAAMVRDLRVRLYVAAGDREAALADAAAAAAAPGAGIADFTRLGDVHAALEDFGAAAAAYDRAIAAAGGDAPWPLFLMKAAALDEAGDWPGAKAALEQAHALAPAEPLVLNYLGYAQLERRENVEAATALVAEAHRLAPDNAAIADSLGWAHYVAGHYARAIPLLEKAVEGEPADVEINEHLGDAYHAAGRRAEARFAWRAALVYAEGEDAERLRRKIEAGPAAPARP